MTIKEIIKKYHKIEIELLLMHVLKKSKEFLFMNLHHSLSTNQQIRLSAMAKRRQKSEPMAYILGYKDFWGLRFKVNKNVLIPRPETEMIVESVKLKVESLGQKNIRILDVGTGSGCIAVSIASQVQGSRFKVQVTASDVSAKALSIAKQNAKYHKVKIKFVQSDLLKNVKGNFDVIIANLPYGWHGVKNRFSSVKDGLKFEPQNALYTKEKGLMEIRRLLEQIAQRKKKPKLLYLEFDPRQRDGLSKLIKKILPKWKTTFHRDLNKLWRYAEIKA